MKVLSNSIDGAWGMALLLLVLAIAGCSSENKDPARSVREEGFIGPIFVEPEPEIPKIFEAVANYPNIADSASFMAQLVKIFDLKEESPFGKSEITQYKKIKIYGSDSTFILLEYYFGGVSGVYYPWKVQLVLTEAGDLVGKLHVEEVKMFKVFPGENPFLLGFYGGYRGNGGHVLLKVSADTLEHTLQDYNRGGLKTHDAHLDHLVYEPSELKLRVGDFNKDGFNDLVFSGKLLQIEGISEEGYTYPIYPDMENSHEYMLKNPIKKIPIRLIYHYNPETGHFEVSEDYKLKYAKYLF